MVLKAAAAPALPGARALQLSRVSGTRRSWGVGRVGSIFPGGAWTMGREALCWGVPETSPRASLSGSAHRPPVPLAALLIWGTSQGRKRHVAKPRRLAEGWRPPDAGCGHLLLIKGAHVVVTYQG